MFYYKGITQIAILLLLTFISTNAEIEVVASWNLATFVPPPGFPGSSPDGSPVHAPGALMTGMQVDKDKFFVGMPRFLPGQPISLGWVPRPPPDQQLPVDTPINAFPDWDWHWASAGGPESAAANCTALVSVFRMKLDRCGRLWVLDTGVPEALVSLTHVCPPKLLAFNASTGEVLYRHEFGPDVAHGISLYTNLALEEPLSEESFCSSIPADFFVYVADTRSPGIVVLDVKNGAAWRHNPPQAYCDPDWGVYTIANESFTLMDAIIGMTVSKPQEPNNDRTVYFQAFASDRIYSVAASALKAKPIPNEDLNVKLVGRKSSQSCPLILDPADGSLIVAPVTETVIKSIHPETKIETVKEFNPELLQGITDVFLEPEQIWTVSTRIQKYLRGASSNKDVHLRILRIGRPHSTKIEN